MKNSFRFLLFSLALFLFQHSQGWSGLRYELINLGLTKYNSSFATNINNNNWVSGALKDGSSTRIFVVDQEKKVALRKERMSFFEACLNDNNEVFGSLLFRASDGSWEFDDETIFNWKHPFNYWQYFNFYWLYYPKHYYSRAFQFISKRVWDVNNLNQIIVMNSNNHSEVANELLDNHVWLHQDGKFTELTHPNFYAGFSINNNSQILGYYFTGSIIHGNRTKLYSLYDFNTKMITKLNLPAGCSALSINDNGQIIGDFYKDQVLYGYIKEPSGDLIELFNFSPDVMNNRGIVVGSYIYGEKQLQLAVYDSNNDIFYDLSEIAPLIDDKGERWESLEYASDINDNGWIVGQGYINGKNHAFLLIPHYDYE